MSRHDQASEPNDPDHLGRRRPGLRQGALVKWATGAVLVMILTATLTPGDSGVASFSACIFCDSQSLADAFSNVALFLPLGAVLIALGERLPRAVLGSAALSVAVEAMQATIVAGRDPSLRDIVFNIAGATAGALLARSAQSWILPGRTSGRLLVGTALVTSCVVVATTGFLLHPALDESAWYGQWTAGFANMEPYLGRVLDARIGSRPVPSWRLDDSGAVRRALLGGRPLIVRVLSSPPTRSIAAIFSVYDDRQREQLLLGANQAALELSVRRRANDAQTVNPRLQYAGALARTSAGDTVTIEVRRVGSAWCVGIVPRVACRGFSAGAGWQLLQDVDILRRHDAIANAFWIFGLLLPVGFWQRGRGAIAIAVGATALCCGVIPSLCGLLTSPPLEWLAGLCGVLCGVMLGGVARQRAAATIAATSPFAAAPTRL